MDNLQESVNSSATDTDQNEPNNTINITTEEHFLHWLTLGLKLLDQNSKDIKGLILSVQLGMT